ncbi:MAG: hypothetical protein AAF567_19505 [Actinomycetota bacterium]
MSGDPDLDLIDAIGVWAASAPDLDGDDALAIARLQVAMEDGQWGDVALADITAMDLETLKADLYEIESPDYTAWILDQVLETFDHDVHAVAAPANDSAPLDGAAAVEFDERDLESSAEGDSAFIDDEDADGGDADTDVGDPDDDDPEEDDAVSDEEDEPHDEDDAEDDPDDEEGADEDGDDTEPIDEDVEPEDVEPEDQAGDAEQADDEHLEPEDQADDVPDEDRTDDADHDAEPDEDQGDEDQGDADQGDDADTADDDPDEDTTEEEEEEDDDEEEEDDTTDDGAFASLAQTGGAFSVVLDPTEGPSAEGDQTDDDAEDDTAGDASASSVDSDTGRGSNEDDADAGESEGHDKPGKARDSGESDEPPIVDIHDHADAAVQDEFFAQLNMATNVSVTGAAPPDLRDGPDILGPSFLAPAEPTGSGRRIGLAVLAVAAVAVFIVAGLQLVNDVSDPEDDEVAVEVDDTENTDDSDREADAVDDDSDSDPDEGAEDEADGSDVDTTEGDEAEESGADPAPTVTPTPAPTPMPDGSETAVILTEDGDVWAMGLLDGDVGEPWQIHDAESDEPAVAISTVAAGISLIDEAGDAYIINLTDPTERARVWRSDRLGAIDQLIQVGDSYAALSRSGSIALFDTNRAATALAIDLLWDTSIGGTPPAKQLDAYIDLMPFVLANGDIQMAVTSAEEIPVVPVWSATEQPRAFNLSIGEHGMLMGVGAGAVGRYQWFEDAPPVSALWDPLDGSRLPAIGYAGLPDGGAIVLNSGTVVSVTTDGETSVIWDAEVSDTRVSRAVAGGDELLLLAEDGSLVRTDGDNGSVIWEADRDDNGATVDFLVIDS